MATFAVPLIVQHERPGVDYADYYTLIISDLDVDNTKIVPPPWMRGQTFTWPVSAANVATLQKEFQTWMREQISGNGGYEIVTAPGPGALEFTVTISSASYRTPSPPSEVARRAAPESGTSIADPADPRSARVCSLR